MHELTVEILDDFNELTLQDILFLENICFPVEWHYPDADKYYTAILRDKRNINILLRDYRKTTGYILSVPHDTARTELIKCDPEIKADNSRYYIETIGVLPQYRRRGGATKLLHALCEEANRKGINNFSIHARIRNGLNVMISNLFKGLITESRKIDSWKFGGGEAYEYIEWSFRP